MHKICYYIILMTHLIRECSSSNPAITNFRMKASRLKIKMDLKSTCSSSNKLPTATTSLQWYFSMAMLVIWVKGLWHLLLYCMFCLFLYHLLYISTPPGNNSVIMCYCGLFAVISNLAKIRKKNVSPVKFVFFDYWLIARWRRLKIHYVWLIKNSKDDQTNQSIVNR